MCALYSSLGGVEAPIQVQDLGRIYGAAGVLGTAGSVAYNYFKRKTSSSFRGSNRPFKKSKPYFTKSSGMRLRSGRIVGDRRNGAARVIQRAFRSSRRVNRPRPTSGRGVTFEHDRQMIYRKKRMPRNKKKRWRKFTGKVNAVAERSWGARTVIFNKSFVFSNNITTKQCLGAACLYSLKNEGGVQGTLTSTDTFNGDLYKIASDENTGMPTDSAGLTFYRTTNLYFHSGVLDLTIRNISYQNTGNELAPDVTLEVDIYELKLFKKPFTVLDNDGFNGSLIQGFAKTEQDANAVNGTATKISLGNRGVTPFDISSSLSQLGVRIYKKTKFFIRNGQTTTYQYRDPKRHVFNFHKLNQSRGYNIPKVTHNILVIAKAIPGSDIGTGAAQNTESIQIGMTRKYLYKMTNMNEDRTAYHNL